jgi:hypothetical protein
MAAAVNCCEGALVATEKQYGGLELELATAEFEHDVLFIYGQGFYCNNARVSLLLWGCRV